MLLTFFFSFADLIFSKPSSSSSPSAPDSASDPSSDSSSSLQDKDKDRDRHPRHAKQLERHARPEAGMQECINRASALLLLRCTASALCKCHSPGARKLPRLLQACPSQDLMMVDHESEAQLNMSLKALCPVQPCVKNACSSMCSF